MNMGYNTDQIVQDIVEIIKDMTIEWDLEFDEPIGPRTRLVADLAFESVDIVQVVVALEEHYQQRGLPWEEFFMKDGRYVDEIIIEDLARFLASRLDAQMERNT